MERCRVEGSRRYYEGNELELTVVLTWILIRIENVLTTMARSM